MSNQGAQDFFPTSKIIPLKYVLKFNPAIIGVIYKLHEKDPKKRLYKIYLHGLINKSNSKDITTQLFEEHKMHLNKKFVSFEQIQSLVQKLLDITKENKKSQKLFAENPTDKYVVKATDKDKIFIKDDTADLLKMNMNKRKDGGAPQHYLKGGQPPIYDQSDNIDHFDSISGGTPLKEQGKNTDTQEDYEFDDDNNGYNGAEGVYAEGMDYEGLEMENGDDLLDEDEYISQLQMDKMMNKIVDEPPVKKDAVAKKGYAIRNFQRGNLSD